MRKICSNCKQEKDKNNFSFKCKKTEKLNTRCRECHRDYRKEHYEKHNTKYKKLATLKRDEIRDRNAEFIFNYLSKQKCIDCNERNTLVLEFDHKDRNTKTIDISRAINNSWSLDNILDEINKCDVRCRNCHIIKTRKENNDRRYQLFLKHKFAL